MRLCPSIAASLFLIALLPNALAQEQAAIRPRSTQANSIGMQLAHIPAGEFFMGATEPAEELTRTFASYGRKPDEFSDEYPRHKVRITKPFLLGVHEVTVGQFRKFVEETGYKTSAETDGKGGWGYDPKSGMCAGRFP